MPYTTLTGASQTCVGSRRLRRMQWRCTCCRILADGSRRLRFLSSSGLSGSTAMYSAMPPASLLPPGDVVAPAAPAVLAVARGSDTGSSGGGTFMSTVCSWEKKGDCSGRGRGGQLALQFFWGFHPFPNTHTTRQANAPREGWCGLAVDRTQQQEQHALPAAPCHCPKREKPVHKTAMQQQGRQGGVRDKLLTCFAS